MRYRTAALCLTTALALPCAHAQQVSDTAFRPHVGRPAFAGDEGPVLVIDEAHHNFHTATGRYLTFARLAQSDGYRVRSSSVNFAKAVRQPMNILVVANALNAENAPNRWRRPIRPAFTHEEVNAVKEWVEKGGSLLIIADHMPFAGAAADLAAAFGVHYFDGFALDSADRGGPTMFRRSDGSLGSHAITNGRTPEERIDSIASFTGSAFEPNVPVDTLMILPASTQVLEPEVAWQFDSTTKILRAPHALQGAVVKVGKGRVAIFGEAAMFSAQVTGPQRRPMGMNHPIASQNAQFALNVLHWMSGLLN
jgi:hypothetical protein